jgi:CheY-like chemotaxis protein
MHRQYLDSACRGQSKMVRKNKHATMASLLPQDSAILEVSMAQRVLVVEDNDDWRAIMSLFLTRMGYSVVQATNGVEAIEKAAGELPHLILMDLKLPKLSGLEAAAQIKENPATMNIPVVLCTAFGPEAYKDNPIVKRLAEVVQKPIKLDTFQGLLQKYLPSSTHDGSTDVRAL